MGQKINAFRSLGGKQALEGQEENITVDLRDVNAEDERWIVSNKEL